TCNRATFGRRFIPESEHPSRRGKRTRKGPRRRAMTMQVLTILVVTLALLLPAFLLVRRHRAAGLRDELSPISRQHIDLFQGGQLSEAAVESTKARFRDLLERGEVATVEASLRAGMQYVVQVRSLAELGT